MKGFDGGGSGACGVCVLMGLRDSWRAGGGRARRKGGGGASCAAHLLLWTIQYFLLILPGFF